MQQTDECLQIRETQDSVSCGEHHKGIGWGEIGPRGGEGAEALRDRVMEEDPRFTPGYPLRYERKLLPGEGMEGMGDREDKLPIRVMGYS
jgi:hypothetical protein